MNLSQLEKVRYNRQINIPGWGQDAQKKLKEACVFVAGAGGLGSPALSYLAAAGVGRLIICDHDKVELSNLNRQILHGDADLGLWKVDSAAQRLHELNPDIELTLYRDSITSENIFKLAGPAQALLDCLDNFPARRSLNAASVKLRIPLVHAGVEGVRGQITVFHPPKYACLSCLLPFDPPAKTIPVLGATPGLFGAWQAMEAIKLITGLGESLAGKVVFYDGMSNKVQEVSLERDPDCPVCSSAVLRITDRQ